MFWFGQILGAIGGLLGTTTIRDWIRSRWSKLSDRQFDIARVTLIIVGLIVSGTIYVQATKKISHLELRTKDRVLNPNQKTVALLRKEPHGQVILIFDPVDNFTWEYAIQWAKLLKDTGWEAECCELPSDSRVPPGVTLLISKINDVAPYVLHLRDVLIKSNLPVVVAPPGPFLPNDSKDYSLVEAVLFIGRKPE